MNLAQMRAELERLIASTRAILDGAAAEQRDLNADEQSRFDAEMTQIEGLRTRIGREERVVVLENEQRQPVRPANRPMPDAAIGMNRRETQQYSLVRAIRAAMSNDWRGAELEREASEATARRLGREPNGSFFVPADWMERRDLLVGTATAGGHTVATDLLAQSFIDLLRNRMICAKRGRRC